jgi:SsrA-binding protein
MKMLNKVEIINRRARHEYEFIYMLEAGIMLQGTEIKSIRMGFLNLNDAYCLIVDGQLYLDKLHISEYSHGTYNNHEPRRRRKLLVKGNELRKLHGKVKERGFTIVPYRVYISERGFAKVEIALAKGKKAYDKRESLKEKDVRRDMDRTMKGDY